MRTTTRTTAVLVVSCLWVTSLAAAVGASPVAGADDNFDVSASGGTNCADDQLVITIANNTGSPQEGVYAVNGLGTLNTWFVGSTQRQPIDLSIFVGPVNIVVFALGGIQFNQTFPLAPCQPTWPDFDRDGTSDRSVFRPEVGGWYVDDQTTQFLGLPGDVPVPGDYNGDGTTERAVFRDGTWFVEGEAPVFLGQSGDVPVPGDYDGDGTWEPAVYRDGAWFVQDQATEFLGATGDVPVPGDYDGDGVTERAVFRPSVGGWYVDGEPPEFFGLSTDVPVAGDYDGDSDMERAVYRPEFGGWYVDGQAPVFNGLSTDVPVPADYDGDDDMERAVYRPEFGGWYVDGQAPVFYGLGTDTPLPLPAAVHEAYYGAPAAAPLTATACGEPATRWYEVEFSLTVGNTFDVDGGGGFVVSGGVPPYSFDSVGLDGYTLSPDGVFTHVDAVVGTEQFTLRVLDNAGAHLELPGTIVRPATPPLPSTC